MTKRATLQDRLAQSLDRANTRERTARRQAVPPPAPLAADARCAKVSVSLYPGDLARLDAIRSYMATRGRHVSDSQAVRLALRTAPLAPDMDTIHDAMRSEDGRKRQRTGL